MAPYRILQTGSRTLTVDRYGPAAPAFIRTVLATVWRPDATLVTGDAAGADTLCACCWASWGGTVEHHPADWTGPCRPDCPTGHRYHRPDGTHYCPAAGRYRNHHMIDLGADVCIALYAPGRPSRGTAHCVAAAHTAGIPILEHILETTT